MLVSYYDHDGVTDQKLVTVRKKLDRYREVLAEQYTHNDLTARESSLFYAKDLGLHEMIEEVQQIYKKITHVVLIGVGGSSLGVEAVHQVLGETGVRLTVLDTVAPYKMDAVLTELLALKTLQKTVFCIISKSGATTETLANASALYAALKPRFGAEAYTQSIFIGDAGTPLEVFARKQKARFYPIPAPIGGRFCVATAAGLIPLALLKHDVDEFIEGYLDAASDTHELLVTESAARLYIYRSSLKYQHYNFFAFDPRLEALAAWYRQLFAESLGKTVTRGGKSVQTAMVPAISTTVELHSTGQHYMSGISKVYTDFVSLVKEERDVKIGKSTLAPHLGSKTLSDIEAALYGGVLAAYQQQSFPYRTTILEGSIARSLGTFMAMRIKEILYVASLEDINAFDQPNVELYKEKMRNLLVV